MKDSLEANGADVHLIDFLDGYRFSLIAAAETTNQLIKWTSAPDPKFPLAKH
jgi:hypothetical protein